jgi:2-amino-4-hydroxy-6-hydroxymethyldihydropteridine diphosphokinase
VKPAVPRVYVALGSNLGEPRRNVELAFRRLEELSSKPVRFSSLWRSTPVDCPPGSPEFINAVAELAGNTGETPESLLGRLQALEKDLGRTPKKRINEARIVDLDLIAFGEEVRHGTELILPHPRAHSRRFVLAPLAELAPDLILPGQKKTVRELIENLRTDEVVEKLS